MFGLLNLNKPAGFTSRDAVNRVQNLVRPDKVGHAGTLDPIATGTLVLCVGAATRLIEYVQRMPKRYIATFRLGETSPSDDIELPTTALEEAPTPSESEILAQFDKFLGDIQQVPPAYSAIKIKGKKAYDLARAGHAPELKARPVTIYKIELLRYDYPELVLDIKCGSGTYIRSLGRDLAKSLGTSAVMSALERTEIGPFRSCEGLDPKQVDLYTIEQNLLAPSIAVAEVPKLVLSDQQITEIQFGRMIRSPIEAGIDEVAAIDDADQLLAILSVGKDGQLKPTKNFIAVN